MQLCKIFEMMQLTKPEQLQEYMGRIKVIKLQPGAKLPMAKKGMYIVLKGSLKATTHWKLSDGYSRH